jgi:hydrogenase maturation protease
MILVIGYGNALCGDDGLGVECVRRLVEDAAIQDYPLELIAAHQLTPELVEPISRADGVIFIDAAQTNAPFGMITCRELTPARAVEQATSTAFTHYIYPTTLLEGAESLYGHRPLAYLYTVSGQNFGLGDAFSSAVESALSRLSTDVKARIVQCTNLASRKLL